MFKRFESYTQVHARPMTRGEASRQDLLRGFYPKCTEFEPGYHVIFDRGSPHEYAFWLPAKLFETIYSPVTESVST